MADVQSSLDYTVYLPESGDPIAGLSALQCGDIDSIDDNLSGTVSSNVIQSFELNKPIEISRFRTYSPSQLDITVPEEISSEIKSMRDLDCMIGLQRRYYCDDGLLDHVHHYGYVSFNSIGIRNAATKGLFGDAGIPTAVFPALFGLYQYYDRTGPAIHIEEGWNPIQVTYCSEPSCNPCCFSLGCDVAYALYSDVDGNTKIDRLLINGSVVTSEDFPYLLLPIGETALLCHGGRLFIGFDQNDNVGVMSNQDEIISGDPFSPKGDIIFGSVGTDDARVVKFAASGSVVYALWQDGSVCGIDRNIANGIDNTMVWDTVFSVDALEAIDISAIGSSVSAIIDENIYANYENGIGKFEIIQTEFNPVSLSLFLSNFSLPNCPAMFVLSDNTSLYALRKGGDFELVFSDSNFCSESSRGNIETSQDGFGVWISRAMQRRGKSVVLKSTGKGSDCDWMLFEDEYFFTLDCDNEVAVVSCVELGELPYERLDLTLISEVQAGYVVVCFGDGTTLPGYIFPEIDGTQELAITTTEPINCLMRGGIRSINCEHLSSYPCLGWHDQAFDMCPSNPNKSILVVGASCPTGDTSGMILVKGIDGDGQPEDIVSLKEENCIPNNC